MMWGRSPSIIWGGVLVIVGVLFLLSNLNVNIRWDVLWPLLFILVGVWLLAARVGPGANYSDLDTSEARDGIGKAALELSLGAGQVEIKSASLGDQLYRAHIEHAGASPEVKLDRSSNTVRISTRFDWFMGARRLRISTQLADGVAWGVRCSTGTIRGEFDLSTAQLTSFECRTGASRISVNLPAPKGVVPIRIDGGALRVDVVRPAGAAIKVQSTGGALQLYADGSHQDGVGSREWRSSTFDGASDRYEMAVAGGALNVNVSER